MSRTTLIGKYVAQQIDYKIVQSAFSMKMLKGIQRSTDETFNVQFVIELSSDSRRARGADKIKHSINKVDKSTGTKWTFADLQSGGFGIVSRGHLRHVGQRSGAQGTPHGRQPLHHLQTSSHFCAFVVYRRAKTSLVCQVFVGDSSCCGCCDKNW